MPGGVAGAPPTMEAPYADRIDFPNFDPIVLLAKARSLL
ncbi:MAG: hypothetical protein RIR09_941 [Pseudomonadota bacterium]